MEIGVPCPTRRTRVAGRGLGSAGGGRDVAGQSVDGRATELAGP